MTFLIGLMAGTAIGFLLSAMFKVGDCWTDQRIRGDIRNEHSGKSSHAA